MGSRGRLLFDLNEPPVEDNEDSDGLVFQPQKAQPPSNSHASDLFPASGGSQRLLNNHAFSHASSVSGFQPFVRSKLGSNPEIGEEQKKISDQDSKTTPSSKLSNVETAAPALVSGPRDTQSVEREEGEWSDAEGSGDINGGSILHKQLKTSQEKGLLSPSRDFSENNLCNLKISDSTLDKSNNHVPSTSDQEPNDRKSNSILNTEGNAKLDTSTDTLQEETGLLPKQREVKGIEASHALKCANNPGKRKIDQHLEAKLGKKRNRQTMFLNLEDVKLAGPMKTSTPRRQTFPPPITTRIVKEVHNNTIQANERIGEKQTNKDQKQGDVSSHEGSISLESGESKLDSNGDMSSGLLARPNRPNNDGDIPAEASLPPIPRQGSWKIPTDSRLQRNMQASNRKPVISNQSSDHKQINKKHLPSKKQNSVSTYQDSSVERLIREVTNEKFWHHPEETELQCVPGRFESVEEYIKVFEPLLFEECRAQLYSTWEELSETFSRDTHAMVRVKNIDRRERGWYDVIVLPVNECKWSFKEGDVAVLSSPRPGSVRSKRNNGMSVEDDEDQESGGRVAGTVRRHIPLDTRDPPGAILHFYVGDSYDPNRIEEDHILRKLQTKNVWFLTVLGSLATTQREYVALHAFRRLNMQMQSSILQPSPEQFPKYEQQSPAMPECFTQNFVDYLHRTFNGPQLSAIQWAATHTAAGTSSGTVKRQEPWPFTLVQGPPGTGKTHTVWGMLNVIHLVQYQHYYTSLLKKLAPESYKQAHESSSDHVNTGSIDEVLQSMDQNLLRTLPTLCPKPRMLVCAPSNAATDELLARVLDRGFIDGEMKVYRPDVARVGVDSQTRAAQAVSVERRTEQLLVKSRDEVLRWMHQLKVRETQLAQQMNSLQRELNVAAAAVRSQGSVGVDPDVLVARDQNRDALLQNLAAVIEGRDKILVEMSRLLILESRYRPNSNFNMEDARASLEASFANEAEIVFTTVSSSGRKLFSRLSHGFDMVVIDEAAQASEVAVLPPLSLGAARCVLVGDPQQLPATVISKAAGTLLYSRSLFERFQQAGCPTMLLSVQYRMHPQIRDFPSRYFYQGRLTDSESVANLPDETYYKDPLLRPYTFFDITHGRESHRGGSVSYQNIHEAQFCLRMYEHLQKTVKSLGIGKVSVGIITPYKLQLKCLQREFEEVLNSEEGKDLYINTVDAFQGQERDVIIMSCVRASNHGVGFVADIRRMNVALTRARRALWVMGNANALIQSDDWAALITDAKARNCYMDMESIPKDFLGQKGSTQSTLPGKNSSNIRGLRSALPRHRTLDIHVESRSGTPSEDDEKSNSVVITRNGNYRPSKAAVENSSEDFDQSGEKLRDTWQYGMQKRQGSAGTVGKRDI
ncbi:putative ATP-dependent helicase C29A10.10c-like [Cucumis melo var. makuwa]|uniref:ATP-dependent helicase C29A10.10c-like n=1 Tax=Cucumis melo var. makuwa TaxID=1194695 RepID=A0A5A7VEA2_CUCMM|nr:putative ATP-dependent helicase C29A10.10c-like [Cucumis melo var. makuwa]TYK18595.1 putative ATP-dependent helicase C29A10.10c-like [Cucumis melo var. makuwa]